MASPALIAKIKAAFELLESWQGQVIQIQEWFRCGPDDVGRRHPRTTVKCFQMRLNIGLDLDSGARMLSDLEAEVSYGILEHLLVSAEIETANRITYIERFGQFALRCTVVDRVEPFRTLDPT